MKVPLIAKTIEEQRLKGINYAVKKSCGYTNHLRANSSAAIVDEFIESGLIKTFMTKEQYEKYKITKDGNKYYKDTYGSINYYKARAIGFIDKIIGKV